MDPIEWIKAGLERPGKSQAALAKALGVHPTAVSKMLAGKRQLKAAELEIARAYIGGATLRSEKIEAEAFHVTVEPTEDKARMLLSIVTTDRRLIRVWFPGTFAAEVGEATQGLIPPRDQGRTKGK